MMAATQKLALFVVLCCVGGATWAANRTISGSFDGTEPTMAANPASCDGTAKPYRQIGTIQVSASGSYTFVDGGNDLGYFGPLESGVADIVVMVYEGSFDAGSPSTNRIAFVDESDPVALQTGTSYVLVVQYWCTETAGAFAVFVDGPGTVSGAGFGTPGYTMGEFTGASPTANFYGGGPSRYAIAAQMTVPRSGVYYFNDISQYLGGVTPDLVIYQNSFDPNSPGTNQVASTFGNFSTSFSLQAGVTYVFVVVDIYDGQSLWQFALFPPGSPGFNAGLNGAWVIAGIPAQGILAEIFPDTGVLFFAWFTFQHQLAVVQTDSEDSAKTADGGVTKPQTHLFGTDQRWTTAFGALPAPNQNMMNIKFENSTGGYFYQSAPAATTNSNYGTGWVRVNTCDHITIHWVLPGGVEGEDDFIKLLPDGVPYCESFIKAAPIMPPV